MKLRMLLSATALLGLLAITAAAADVTGKWTAQVPGRDGQTRETTFNLNQEGAKLTGTMSGRQGDVPISDGKVAGDSLSFTVNMNMGGNQIKLLYKGTISGAEIKFTRQREGGDQPPQEFIAKRAVT